MDSIKVNVKQLRGETFSVEISPSASVAELKESIAAVSEISVELQRVIFRGKALLNHELLKDACFYSTFSSLSFFQSFFLTLFLHSSFLFFLSA